MNPEHAARLRRLLADPASIRSLWTILRRPWLRWVDYEPNLQATALEAVFERSRVRDGVLLEQAWAEFERNLEALEQNYVVHGQNEARHLNWLERSYTLLVSAERLVKLQTKQTASNAQRWVARRHMHALRRRAQLPLRAIAGSSGPDVQRLAGIDALLDAADEECDFLGRRRGLLEGARELLLRASESVANDTAIRTRLQHVTQQLGELSRLESDGVRMDVAVTHQLSSALATQSPTRLGSLLSAVENTALSGSSERTTRLQELSSDALGRLWGAHDRSNPIHRKRSVALSGKQTLQAEVDAAITQGYETAGETWQERAEKGRLSLGARQQVERYLSESAATDLVHAALYVDGCVDVGGVLSPRRITDVETVIREVPYPTQKLTLNTAEHVGDIPNALISDPRSVLLDLATGRLLTRRYLAQEKRGVGRNVMASEVRIFLLDGSGSMLGPRARMRDAILVAELSTLIARLNQRGRWITPTLFYRYFTEKLGPVHEIGNSEQAVAAIRDVLGEVRWGGTNIQGALLESFDTVRAAKDRGEELAHAQIVLITDGEAAVDEAKITRARERVGDVPIGVSIIALGEENPTLRQLAHHQRTRGERVFYQFIPDDLIRDLVEGHEVMLPLHLPDTRATEAICADVRALVREMELLQRTRDEEAMASVNDEVAAMSEVGLALNDLRETERARILALNRDAETLKRRFERWFPKLPSVDPGYVKLAPSAKDDATVSELSALLAAVAETTELAGGSELRRLSDAVEMLERLLRDVGIGFALYEQSLRRYPGALAPAVEAVRQVAGV